ncbi:hypothetical protein INR49_020725 [Caranx melampygus]|nr:hypothetical protein INR49_020725 [Caranx melampygus]
MQKGLKKYFINMDEYLSSLGLYRKMVARDASSLFRAVSEQLYYSQNYHQRIRQDCANHMRAHRSNFEPFVEGSFEKYLERLEDPKETVGQVEIKALSQLYRRCFLIYRYPGKPATVISEDDFVDKVMLCCSINGHYDIVYPRSYPASAALCQSLLYELLYTQVFGVEEAELCQAMETFRVGGRRYRNSPSVCSDVDIGYDTPEDRGQSREEGETGGAEVDDTKSPAEAPPPSRLCLTYKVMKSLDGDVYRNLEFDVRLEPKGKYYNAFIQEVGTHSSAVTVFIEELGEKHLVPLMDLKPVNPVPAWNVAAPARKGDLDSDSRGQRHHRHRYFRKSRGNSGVKGAELLMVPPSTYGGPAPSSLPPRFQPAGHPRPPPPPSPGALTYDPYPPTHHPTTQTRPPRYGASRSSTRFVNRHLIGPQLTYYHPGRRYYHDYENYAFRSRRSRRQLVAALNKEFTFTPETGEEPADLDAAMAYYQLDDASDAVFPPLPVFTKCSPGVYQVFCKYSLGVLQVFLVFSRCSDVLQVFSRCSAVSRITWSSCCTSSQHQCPSPGSSYRVQRGSGPLPSAPPPGNTPVCSSEEEQEDTSTVEDQDQSYQTSGVYSATESTPNQLLTCRQLVTHSHAQVFSMTVPASSPWLVNELGEPLCTTVAPPPYSYDPNGSDLPRDCRVLQYYFNLGVQWYHQAYQQQTYPPPSPEAPTPTNSTPPQSYPESSRAGDVQTDGHSSGRPRPIHGRILPSSTSSAPHGPTPCPALLYPDQQPLPLPRCFTCHMKLHPQPPTCPPPLILLFLTPLTSLTTPPTTASPHLSTGGRSRPEATPQEFTAPPLTPPMLSVTSLPHPPTTQPHTTSRPPFKHSLASLISIQLTTGKPHIQRLEVSRGRT